MKRASLSNILAVTVVLSALFSPATVSAQYIWLDEKGTKQFSDMPPPPSVPPGRILKQPAARPAASAGGTGDAKPATPARTEPTIAEKNAEFRKRKAEQAEKEKKAGEEAQRAADNAKNCERARDYQRLLDSGERIARTDKNGERSFLSDEQRAQESHENKRNLADCK
ncbi:DUF4124 domain-containing protein [Noviherbaspirillum sp. ST9]|uniref:DUF4124 domain-containing protein n=1 Tax=Noviherbaspirillum sp. ST9 TaxID=3401606 RepID=UPI003B587C8C